MSGFFLVTDIPNRRVVQYKRKVSDGSDNYGVYIEDESVLGAPVDEMPYADKTGLAATTGGMTYEVPYLADAGDVYFSKQPKDETEGDTLTVEAKAGTAPYSFQWYKDDKQVVNVPDSSSSLKAADNGSYFCVVTDSNGVQAVSKAATVAKGGE